MRNTFDLHNMDVGRQSAWKGSFIKICVYDFHIHFVSPGIAGGSHFTNTGGGSNYQCLPRNPEWGRHTDGIKSGTYMYGAEYEFPTANSPFLKVI